MEEAYWFYKPLDLFSSTAARPTFWVSNDPTVPPETFAWNTQYKVYIYAPKKKQPVNFDSWTQVWSLSCNLVKNSKYLCN